MLYLRKENFGGIVFNPDNAHELWLDNELYGSLLKALNGEKKFLEKEMVKKAINELKIKKFSYLEKKVNHNYYNDYLTNPNFLVLSSPILADLNITYRCNANCPHCYVASHSEGKMISLSDFKMAMENCRQAGIMQIAIGGGEPTLHPDFFSFLKIARQADIVPNITTNGKVLKWNTVYNLAKYCGAVALSAEEVGEKFEKRRGFPFKDFIKSVKKIKHAGINLVFQVVISKNNLKTINYTVKELLKFKPYGIIFLAYKPQGRGKYYDEPLTQCGYDAVREQLDKIFNNLNNKTKIGFDCCLTPSLMSFNNFNNFTGCSAARTSLAIMPDLSVLPCSFLGKKWSQKLKRGNLLSIWRSDKFNNFRNLISNKMNGSKCRNCKKVKICLGGCPEFELVKCAY